MAKKMKVWVGDVSKSRFTVAHVVYGEAQPMQSRAGCLVDFGGDHHERVFTESEVRALAKRLRDQMYDDFKSGLLYDFDTYFDSQVVAFFSDPA